MKKVLIVLMLIFLVGISFAEEDIYTEDMWIMCKPDSMVNVRFSPKKTSEVTGYLMLGDKVRTDLVKKNNYYHVYVDNEDGEGWVHEWYLVQFEPVIVNKTYMVVCNGRLAVRRGVNGSRKGWLKNGTEVMVYAIMDDEWAVTNYGFVMIEFMEEVAE